MGGGIQDGLQPVLQLAGDTSENRVAVVHVADNQYTNQGQQGVSRRSSAFTDATSAGVTAENSRTTHPTGAGVKDGGSTSAVAERTVTTAPGRAMVTAGINSKVDVCEKAKHHTELFWYKFIFVTALARHIVQQIQQM